MPEETTFQKAQRIIEEQLGIRPGNITPESTFDDDFGTDSLDRVEIVMAAEEEFEIEISDEDAEAVKTVQDAVNLVDRLVKEEEAK
jgi:acyl carrier protein